MISTTLEFLRKHLDGGLRLWLGGSLDDGTSDKVVFPNGAQEPGDPIHFTSGAVTMLLVNLEEERMCREADPYRRVGAGGGMNRVQPDIRLSLYILFVARFSDYLSCWTHLDAIVRQFQAEPVLDPQTTPQIPEGVERLVFELVTQSFTELNDVWNALRTTHHPSVLYRVRLLTIRDSTYSSVTPVTEVMTTIQPWKES